MLGRVLGRSNFLNDSLLVYGILPPLALCYENETEETEAEFVNIPIKDETCSSIIASGTNAQPGKFNITVPIAVADRQTVYIAKPDCASRTRSAEFDVICKSWCGYVISIM